MIEGTDLTVDESFYSNVGSQTAQKKNVATENNLIAADPFLLSNSLVASGSGKAVVCAVGANSRRGLKEEKLDTSSKTPLQMKLENLGNTFTKWGLYASGAILLANIINMIIRVATMSEYRDAGIILNDLATYLTLSITLIIVAVPEGLPLAIMISLAHSVLKMKNDGVLVKNLNSPEVMGKVDEIITGKTGTLTEGDMNVKMFYTQSKFISNNRKNTFFNCDLNDSVLNLIQESIMFNCEARIEMDNKAYYIPVGNGTEVGLLKFLQDAQIPVHDAIKAKFGRIICTIPFSTIRKRSVTAVAHPEQEGVVRVYMKGAPEAIISKCSRTIDSDGDSKTLDDDEVENMLQNILHDQITTKGYRGLAMAYKDLSVEDFESLR